MCLFSVSVHVIMLVHTASGRRKKENDAKGEFVYLFIYENRKNKINIGIFQTVH